MINKLKIVVKVLFISPVFAAVFFTSGYTAIRVFLMKGISLNFFLALGGFACFVALLIIGVFFFNRKDKFRKN